MPASGIQKHDKGLYCRQCGNTVAPFGGIWKLRTILLAKFGLTINVYTQILAVLPVFAHFFVCSSSKKEGVVLIKNMAVLVWHVFWS